MHDAARSSSSTRLLGKASGRYSPGIAAAIAFLVYVPSIAYTWVFDDVPQIVENFRLTNGRFVPAYFSEHLWAHMLPAQYANYYRPVFLLWLRLNYALFGTAHAWPWHITAILLHVVATYLVVLLAREITQSHLQASTSETDSTAVTAALLFAVHPSHVEAVAWISGASETLFACFCIGALTVYLRWRKSQSSRYLLGLALLTAGTLLSKESGMTLVIILMAWELLPSSSPMPASLRWKGITVVALLTAAYVPLRIEVLHGWSHVPQNGTLHDMLRTVPQALAFYLRHLLVAMPYGFYGYSLLRHFDAMFWASLLFVLLITACLLIAAKHVPFGRAALVIIFVPLIPVLVATTSFISRDLVHDRYLYVPSAGLCILIAGLLSDHARKKHFVGALALGWTIMLVLAEPQWRSDATLYAASVQHQPGSSFARTLWAGELIRQGRSQEAVAQYEQAIALDPQAARAYSNFAEWEVHSGDCSKALPLLQRSIALDPRSGEQHYLLAYCELRTGDAPDAIVAAQQTLALTPKALGVYPLIGDAEMRLGKTAAARAAYVEEMRRDPQNTALRKMLDRLP